MVAEARLPFRVVAKVLFSLGGFGDPVFLGARRASDTGDGYGVRPLRLAPAEPPDVLFHGAPSQALPSIREHGLVRMTRHHVHLSPDETTAAQVGGRRGKAVILRVDAARMCRDGHEFYCSANGVWLTEEVPPDYIEGLDEG